MAHKCDGCKYKGEHQEMMFRPFGVCNRGANLLEAAQNYEAKKCPYKKTNADRIRAMSDEELSKMLTVGAGGFDCGECRSEKATCEGGCVERCLEWLQQPAKG
jgi:hypothetical protein